MFRKVANNTENSLVSENDLAEIDLQTAVETLEEHSHISKMESSTNTKCALCTCNDNTERVTDYFQDQISSSSKLVEESNQWVHSLHRSEKHRKENRMLSPHDTAEPQCRDFEFVTSENDLDDHNNSSHNTCPLYLLEDDLVLLEIDDDIEEHSIIAKDKSSTTPLHFNGLPDELKMHVFSYFTKRELCRFVAPVCSSWFYLAKDPMFWMIIYNEEFIDVDSDLLIEVLLAWCKNLTHLQLDERQEILNSDFERIFEHCIHIEHLSLKLCKQISNKTLQFIAKHCKQLKVIDLEGCTNVTDKSFYYLISLPLHSVGVAYCDKISDDGGIFLARNFSNLRRVNFEGIQWMTNYFVKVLVEQHHATLEEIQLDGEKLTNLSISELTKCKRLR